MSGTTEHGKTVHGLLFIDTPWVFWERDTRTACCERCGVVTELWDQQMTTDPGPKLLAFWNLHAQCVEGDDVPTAPKTAAHFDAVICDDIVDPPTRKKKGPPADPRMLVIFPPMNKVKWIQIRGTDAYGKPIEVRGTGLPSGLPFEIRRVDGFGAWMYGPGFGGRPKGEGPVCVLWHHE